MRGLVLVVLVSSTGEDVAEGAGQSKLFRNLAVLKLTFLWVLILPNSFLTVA